MEYVQEQEAAVLAFSNGEIYFFEPATKEVKDAGVLSGSILAARWSPNEEYYAVASGNGQLYMFTPEFDILYECAIDDGDLTFDLGGEVTDEAREITQACISWRGDSSIF